MLAHRVKTKIETWRVRMENNKTKGLLSQIGLLFQREEKKSERNLKPFLGKANREMMNANAHLKRAELFEKNKERKNARLEYLKAAEIFCNTEQYKKGAAIYSKILQQEPDLEFVHLKLADINKKMGFAAEAFNNYQKLYCSYKDVGMKDKALEMFGFMADLDPEKFTLDENNRIETHSFREAPAQESHEKTAEMNLDNPPEEEKKTLFSLAEMLETDSPVELGEAKTVTWEEKYGCENIFGELKEIGEVEKIYPYYHYQMGLVCKEMGLIDEAIRQFRTALEKNQKPIEAAKLLEDCFKEKGCWEGGSSSSGREMQVENIPEAAQTEVPSEIVTGFPKLLPQLH